ncbi:hypothetical protein BD779DRAFT_1607711 [Infundibulicybe gibba]|nr:hypothetical protein BD779DRAFT_1607711 [Infundibulicybe gibba]
MESPGVSSPVLGSFSGHSSRSRSSTKLADDVTSLTSFNPFAEEDENDQSSYTIVTSILSRVKNSLSAPLSSAVAVAAGTNGTNGSSNPGGVPGPGLSDQRRPSTTLQTQSSFSSRGSANERPNPFSTGPVQAAPPLISLTPAQSEVPTYSLDYERSPSRSGSFYGQATDTADGPLFGTSIPGFPIQDDARSIKTTASMHRSGSVSKVIRRIRGEGLSRDYWMDDENCKECYDCKSVFTTWRRKHHCRICGQIFCSRCASNIIKGSRFGHEGMVRVCNLCLDKLAKVDDDDDDDRRSVISSVTTSFPPHQFGADNLGNHPQSPFAASQLFGRTDEPFNLFSIAETKRPISRSDESGYSSRPITPRLREGSDGIWEPIRDNPAPFRRGLSDEEKDPGSMPLTPVDTLTIVGSKRPVEFPTSFPAGGDGTTSSVEFPVGSPEHDRGSPQPHGRLRSRFNSYGDFEIATPFIRSRVQSRLDDVSSGEPGWRMRRESTAYAHELNLTSMLHLKIMLRQMLTSEQIPNITKWEDTLLKLALRIARELTFTTLPHRQGEDMDVRKYVKIKKIPGGSPQDSEYVDGAVITKNAAHKQMSRFQHNPRVMLITFPLEFYRIEGQYMHFAQILRQEKELALDALASHNIAVARTVKPSAIATVARMTQGDVFSSMDKLALEPRLGHCARFRIQTFDHVLIPGRRKTYMRFEGCSRDMGCTIILRGADIDTLRRIKKVTRFLTFIVRNLKLETHLWKDSVITLPSFNANAIPSPLSNRPSPANSATISAFVVPNPKSIVPLLTPIADTESQIMKTPESFADDLPDDDAEQLRLTRRIDQALEPYSKTFISVSATLRFPPPYPIRRMKELDNELVACKRAWEDEVVSREEKGQLHQREATIVPTAQIEPAPSDNQEDGDEKDLHALIEALPISDLPVTPPGDSPSAQAQDDASYFSSSATSSSILNTSSTMTNPVSIEPPEVIKTPTDIALESRYSLIKWQHEEHRRIWEWYLRKNKDDFVVEKYQCISLWEYTIPTAEFGQHRACFAPQLNYITFYGENDCTLGQYIERSFLDPKAICTGKGCDQPLARHCKVYVHNETRIFVTVEQWDGQIIGRSSYLSAPDLVTTWSACRVCGSATPFIPVSEEMQRYSFAKFLELHFYPADVKLVQGAGCQHNIYQHHIRYFASKGMTVRFQTDPVTMHEIVYPPFRIRVCPETQLELKNRDFEWLHHRNTMWYTGLVDDLKLISIEAATGDEESDAQLLSNINTLIIRAEMERDDISRLIDRVYVESTPTDTLALNHLHSYRQDKIVAWQQDFDRLPKTRPMQPTDRSSKRASAFGSVRAIWPRRYDLTGGTFESPHLPSASVSEAEEGPSKTRRSTGGTLTSSASEASEPETSIKPSPGPYLYTPLSSAGASADLPPKDDADSDSTIGANRDDAISPQELPMPTEIKPTNSNPSEPVSRLTRPPSHVAELIKKYQDFLPPQGVQDLVKTAFPPRPPVSESEQEYPPPVQYRSSFRRSRHQPPARKPSVSDFEQGYAANVAPRYLTSTRRTLGVASQSSRIPGPVGSTMESQESSRRPSPEKRSSSGRRRDLKFNRAASPTNSKAPPTTLRSGKARAPSRSKEKHQIRTPSASAIKSAFRRPPVSTGSKVSNMAKHFERLGRDAERSKNRYSVIRGKRARPVASARARVEILDSVKDAIKDESESSDSSSEADDEDEGNDEDKTVPQLLASQSPPNKETSRTVPKIELPASEVTEPSDTKDLPRASPPLPPVQVPLPPSPFLASSKATSDPSPTPPMSDLELGPAGTSFLKAISGLWLQPSPAFRHEADDPMSDPEHIFRDSSMIVRTDEPTSIIALALNSPLYRDMLAKSRADKRTAREAKLTDGGEAFMPDDRSIAESSTWGVVNMDSTEAADPTEDLKVPSSKLPWAISFDSGGLTISCTVLYPEQFDALRRTYDCEKSMIESLSRCVKWNASGGKSGSAFLKTRDDRFIAKELSRPELQTMETFAPAYFDYMSSAVSANRPTLLAKVFGCYKLTFKKSGKDKSPGKSKSMQMNLLVMENLFYDRRFTKIYDLKGSTRNRHVQSTGRENEVLLDENLVETAHLNPFYLREHSKRILRGALYNDSKFLADINVMDYSLVCGVDSHKNELVIGIVDYIRTYTWDKKLESWVKESAFLGGGRGEPTIVTPKQYRQRFISAMERYFPVIPDRWMKQRDTPEEDPNSLLELWPDW